MKRIVVAIIGLIVMAIAVLWLVQLRNKQKIASIALPSLCEDISFENARYIICVVDSASTKVALHLNDDNDRPWRSLQRLADYQREQGVPFTFAMNAGMYHEDLSPVGLHVEGGKQVAPLNSGSGEGNFFMKPNGVFGFAKDGKPFILDTVAYLNAAQDVTFATQSGPMLVIDGSNHPRFEPDGKSRFIRNGVGITEARKLVFAISRDPVSFGAFARMFQQRYKCRNALYFDGVVSAFSNGESTVEGGSYPAGPIVSVTAQ